MIRRILTLCLLLILVGCSATKYVPMGESLLVKNRVVVDEPKGANIDRDELESYIQQSPNRKLLGLYFNLGIYNMTDTSKHTGWHKFWSEKVGEPPAVLDSSKVAESSKMMDIYLESMGFLNAELRDTIEVGDKRKSTVVYTVDAREPFTFGKIEYRVADNFLLPIIESDTVNSLIKSGGRFERKVLESERQRISEYLGNQGFWSFNQNYISYVADSSKGNSTVDLRIVVAQQQVGQDAEGAPIYANHPIYRIGDITMNSDYDPSLSESQQARAYDTLVSGGVDILYRDKLLIREKIIMEQLGMSPGELYSQDEIEQTYANIRSLGYNPSIIFSPLPIDSSKMVYVTTLDGEAQTTQRELSCVLRCTPTVRQNFSVDFEVSTNVSYLSLGLGLGYQNRNLFGGAEIFNASVRGAYEFLWDRTARNSFEFSVSSSLSVPRFWLPISPEVMRGFKYSSTDMSLSYSIQRRPTYERSIVSATYGYGWTLNNGARFNINPVDVNVVSVPWVDAAFLEDIANPYLRDSYQSQLISGLSASYYYNTNPDIKGNGFTFKINGDINGNLFYGLSSLFNAPKTEAVAGDSYFTLFGLRYSQYVRMMAEVSNRVNFGKRSQIAWRVLAGAGYAYGNSSIIPIERQYFAGGSNSMRGWQVRTLGPGSTLYDPTQEEYPDQFGNIRFEANLEYRVNVAGGLNLALFLDCGNIWINGDGEERAEAKYNFLTAYQQLALNTGVGLRYDLNFFLLRLDWGIKLHNPNAVEGQRWFKQMGLDQTALHFAIGLPF